MKARAVYIAFFAAFMVCALLIGLHCFEPEELSIHGVRLGMTPEEVTKLHGSPLSGDESLAYYAKDGPVLVLAYREGRVTSVQGLDLEVGELTLNSDDPALTDRLKELFGEPDMATPNDPEGAHRVHYSQHQLTVEWSSFGVSFALGKPIPDEWKKVVNRS